MNDPVFISTFGHSFLPFLKGLLDDTNQRMNSTKKSLAVLRIDMLSACSLVSHEAVWLSETRQDQKYFEGF